MWVKNRLIFSPLILFQSQDFFPSWWESGGEWGGGGGGDGGGGFNWRKSDARLLTQLLASLDSDDGSKKIVVD